MSDRVQLLTSIGLAVAGLGYAVVARRRTRRGTEVGLVGAACLLASLTVQLPDEVQPWLGRTSRPGTWARPWRLLAVWGPLAAGWLLLGWSAVTDRRPRPGEG